MKLQNNVDLSARNSLALPGRAAFYARIASANDLTNPQLTDELGNVRRFVLGGGSNLVVTGDFDGLVLHMAIPGRQLVGEDADAWYVEAGGGENWHDFVQWTLAQGWPGLENLSLIPGTVGAAPVQNIGAYGLEMSERFHSLIAWDFEKQEFMVVDRSQARFAYRDSLFKQEGWHLTGRVAIVNVTFRLEKHWRADYRYADVAQALASQEIVDPTPQQIAAAISSIRRHKLPDPALMPNAGSFFKNPLVDREHAAALSAQFPSLPTYPQPDERVKLAAGWLIEQAGWRGKDLGPVGMYERQALVLVNRGGASGADIKHLMHAVQAAVYQRFAVNLVPEPIFL